MMNTSRWSFLVSNSTVSHNGICRGGGRIIPSLNLFFHLQTFVITQNMKCNTDQYHRLQPLSTKKATFSFIYPLEASSDWLRQLPVLHRVAWVGGWKYTVSPLPWQISLREQVVVLVVFFPIRAVQHRSASQL